jgi:hypothetical protein
VDEAQGVKPPRLHGRVLAAVPNLTESSGNIQGGIDRPFVSCSIEEATMGRTLLAVMSVIFLAGSSAGAHHSYAAFFTDQTVSVEGKLQHVLYANPHTILTLRTKDSHTYTAIWRPVSQLRDMGVAPTTLNIGDDVVISGSPSRDASAHRLALLKQVRRPRDGWSWLLQAGRVTVVPSRQP